MANFCCSIEMEPRTLNQGQINNAREIAVDVIQTKEPAAASSIFNEGLKPLVGLKDKKILSVSDTDQTQNVIEESKKTKTDVESCCQCSCMAIVSESPAVEFRVKEPVSAPF